MKEYKAEAADKSAGKHSGFTGAARVKEILGETYLDMPGQLARLDSRLTISQLPKAPADAVFSRKQKRHNIFRPRLGIAAALAAAMIIFSIEPLRIAGQDAIRLVLERLFPRTQEAKISIDSPDSFFEAGLFYENPEQFSESLPFTPRLWKDYPEGSYSIGYEYLEDRRIAVQWYNGPTAYVRISQQPLEYAQGESLLSYPFNFVIPADALTERVNLGEFEAELVRGMWVTSVHAGNDSEYRWDSGFWAWTLRFADFQFIFEIMIMPNAASEEINMREYIQEIARNITGSTT